jgi:nickel transport protein
VILGVPTPAPAHKVYLFAWVDGDTVRSESYFGSKKKVQDGLIEVFDASGKKLLEGRTDEEGRFSFETPLKADLRIVVTASMGHKGEYLLGADEFSGMTSPNTEPAQSEGFRDTRTLPVSSLDAEQIRLLLEQALDAKLKPLQRELALSRKEKGPGFREALAGIGYIFGVMGLIMYLRSRRKPRQ